MKSVLRYCAIAAAALFIIASFARLFKTYWFQFESVTELALEKPAINTVMLVQNGENIYSEKVYADVPFHLSMYPPAYHYLVAWLPRSPGNPYRTGRLVSAVFMLLAASTLFWRARSIRSAAIATVAVAFFLSLIPVARETFFARQDPMGLFFSVASILLLASSNQEKKYVILSAIAAFIAVITKQNFVSAALAAGIFLALTRRQHLGVYLRWYLGLCAGFALFAQLKWGSGFWWSVMSVPTTSFKASSYAWPLEQINIQFSYPYFILLALAFTWFFRKRELFFIYWAVSAVLSLLLVAKEGSGPNYFFEPTLAGLLFFQDRLDNRKEAARMPSWAPALIMIGLAICFVRDWFRIPRIIYSLADRASNEASAQYVHSLRADLNEVSRLAPGNRMETILVYPSLRDEVTSLGKIAIFSDFNLYGILARERRLTFEEPLRHSIERGALDVMILPHDFAKLERDRSLFGEDFYATLSARYVRVLSTTQDYYVWAQPPP